MMTTIMTNEEIIRMAREAGFPNKDGNLDFWFNMEMLERFAALVTEATKAQPQGEWVELTGTEMGSAWRSGLTDFEFACAIIAKFKEKNTPPVVPQGEPVGYIADDSGSIIFAASTDAYPLNWVPVYTTPPSVEAAMSELQHKYDELLEHYTWQGNQYMEAMRNKAAELEAAIEATKEKAANVCEEMPMSNWFQSDCAAAIRSMK